MKIVGFLDEETGVQKIPVYEWHHDGAVGYVAPIMGLEESSIPVSISDARFDGVAVSSIVFFREHIKPEPGWVLLYTDTALYVSVDNIEAAIRSEVARLRAALSKERKNGRNAAEMNRLTKLVAVISGVSADDLRILYMVRLPEPRKPGTFVKYGPMTHEQALQILKRWDIAAEVGEHFLQELDYT